MTRMMADEAAPPWLGWDNVRWHAVPQDGALELFLKGLAERRPALARRLLPFCRRACATAGRAVKGDLLYLMGVAGSVSSVPFLRRVLATETDVEVREAALEALARIAGEPFPPADTVSAK